MMIAIDVSTVKIFGWPMLITRISAAITPMTTAGTIGVWVFGLTRASFSPNGSALSRAIAKVSRIAAVCTASVQTVTATTMQTRKTLPSGPHITCSTMYCRPPLLSPIFGSFRSGADITANTRMRAADHEGRQDRPQDRLGRGAARLDRLLAQRAGGVEAVHHVAATPATRPGRRPDSRRSRRRRSRCVEKKISGPRVTLTARMMAISIAAISSMNTPALLIIAISFTPSALTTVVNTMRTLPRTTALTAKRAGAVTDDLESAPQPRQVQLVGQHHRRDRHDRRGQHQPATFR